MRLFEVFVPQHMTLFSSRFVAKCKQCFLETVLKKVSSYCLILQMKQFLFDFGVENYFSE